MTSSRPTWWWSRATSPSAPARGSSARRARFLDSLPAPQVVVPGNHDVPLYNVLRAFPAPARRATGARSGADVEPSYVDDEIAVLGVNSAHALTFKNGRINRAQLAAVTDDSRPSARV